MDFIRSLEGFQPGGDGAFNRKIHNTIASDLSII